MEIRNICTEPTSGDFEGKGRKRQEDIFWKDMLGAMIPTHTSAKEPLCPPKVEQEISF